MNVAREIHLKSRPVGEPKAENFELVERPLPELADGDVLVRNVYMSVDPYMRGRMRDVESYVPPFAIGEALQGGAIGKVEASNHPDIAAGDYVSNGLGWRDYFVAPGETLQAVRRHASHDVLAEPGTADLTAHVDFESLARAAAEAGARVYGPIPQGEFLEALGVGVRAEALIASATPAQAADLRAACRRLTDPAEMGALFKVLALADPRRPAPAGFEADP